MKAQKRAKIRPKSAKKASPAAKIKAKQVKKLHNSMQDNEIGQTEAQIDALESQWNALYIYPKSAEVACEATFDDYRNSCAVQTDVLKQDAAVYCASVCVLDSLVERYIGEDARLCARIEQLNGVITQYQQLARSGDERVEKLQLNLQDSARAAYRLQDENAELRKRLSAKQAQADQLGQRNERLIEQIDRLNAMVYCSDIWGEMLAGEEQYIEESM